MWSLNDWEYLMREIVTDPKGRKWTIALMDVLGQKGDPEMPSDLLQLQYASGRYFTLIYSSTGSLQWERGYATEAEATTAYERLRLAVADGRVDPAQPRFREDLEDN